MAAILKRYEPDNIDQFVAKKIFKVTEYAFKITGWTAVLGLLKFVYDKTKSVPAGLIYILLSILLFGHIFTAINAINFRFFDKSEKRFHFFNLAMNVSLTLIIYAGTLYALFNTIAVIEAAK